jgi:hypothetical protein
LFGVNLVGENEAMNFSAEIVSHKVAVYQEIREFHTGEIQRIDRLMEELEWESVEDEEGEIIPCANYAKVWSKQESSKR